MKNVITKKYAQKLIKEGKARIATPLKPDNNTGKVYVAIDRLDWQTVQHFED